MTYFVVRRGQGREDEVQDPIDEPDVALEA
jgi:hypothetical protein